MLIDIYKRQIKTIEAKLENCYEMRSNATVGTEGEYTNQIKKLEEEHGALSQKIKEEEEKYKEPGQVNFFCYVLVSTRVKVKQNVGSYLFSLFDPHQYHDSDYSQWRPFSQKACIAELLSFVTNQYGAQLIYLDAPIDQEHWVHLDDDIHNSIAVIDLFSLNESNKLIGQKFDTEKAGVAFPICRTLNKELYKLAETLKKDFHVLNAKTKSAIPCDFFASDLPGADSFIQHLLRICKQKFLIKNKCSTQSNVRNVNISLL